MAKELQVKLDFILQSDSLSKNLSFFTELSFVYFKIKTLKNFPDFPFFNCGFPTKFLI